MSNILLGLILVNKHMRSVDFCLRSKLERYILQKLNICRYMLPYSFEDRILRELLLDVKS